jgi:hypothetical protein
MMEIKGNYLYVAARCALMIFEFNLPPVDCGDASAYGTVNVNDAIYIINYIFVRGNQPCDTDGDGISDC